VVHKLTVSERDLETLNELLDPEGLVEREPVVPGEVFPRSLLADLGVALGCDRVAYAGSDMSRRDEVVAQAVRPDGSEPPTGDIIGNWEGYFESEYNTYAMRTGDLRSVTKLSDFSSTSYYFAHDPFAYAFRSVGIRHHMGVSLPPIGEVDYDVCIAREDGPDFTERDRLLLQLLRPHLIALHRAALAAQSPRPPLTPRQREVLSLVARGLTDGQIARRLGTTEATVGKHLENIYTKLGVTNRVAAIEAADLGAA
jgi:DNA-binding CsgD family transcriptional regulator